MTRPNECAYCGYDLEDCKCERQEQIPTMTPQHHNYPEVEIHTTDDSIDVTVTVAPEETEEFHFASPGIITGSDLRDILAVCGIHAEYQYEE